MNSDELYEFKETEKGYALARYLMSNAAEITEIEIPSEYRSKPVTEIGGSAFKGAKYLRSVIIPDSVLELGTEVFRNCLSLTEVKLPKWIYCIPAFAFDGCSSLRSIDLPDGVTAILDDAFVDCVSLEEIVLPKCFQKLDTSFSGCTNLRSVVFQSEGVYVSLYAFDDCPALPAETVMRALVPGDDITAPFVYYYDKGFGWWTALRQDVFELAMKYNSFSQTNKSMLFYMIFSEELFAAYYPIMRDSGWLYREENMTGFEKMLSEILGGEFRDNPEVWENMDIWVTDEKLFDGIITQSARRPGANGGRTLWEKILERSVSLGKTEVTAWLLEYQKRKFGFDGGKALEL